MKFYHDQMCIIPIGSQKIVLYDEQIGIAKIFGSRIR